MDFFDRIEDLRKKAGISQGKLEELLDFSNGSINKWKNSVPKADRLQKVAEYFGVSIDYLMTGEPDRINTIAAHHDEVDWTSEELEEIENFKKYVLSKRNK